MKTKKKPVEKKKIDLIRQVQNSSFKKLPPNLWNKTIRTGLLELTQDTNIKKYKYLDLKFTKEYAEKIKKLDKACLNEIAEFDNQLKENYDGWVVNVIDYKEGKIYVVKYD